MSNRVEEALMNRSEEYKHIEAPEQMEGKLRQALKGRKRGISLKSVAAALLAVLLFSYSFDSLAYYGIKFMDYDQLTLGGLKQLNEEGKGQEISKSCTFSNGVTVTIDGIMFDENNLVAFYKIQSNGEEVLEDLLENSLPKLHLYGIRPGGYYSTSGHGMNVDEHNMTFVDTLKAPEFYEKWMSLEVSLRVNNENETQSIKFTLDSNKAAERTAKLDLNSEAALGDYRIVFDLISASTMSTVISGRVIPLTDDALNAFDAKTAEASFEVPTIRFDIMSDEEQLCEFSGNQSVSGSDIRFTSRSDALPKDFSNLTIKNIRMNYMKMVDETVKISEDTKDLKISDDLAVKEVYQDGNIINLVLLSRGIPIVGLFDGERQLEQINGEELNNLGVGTPDENEQAAQRVYSFTNPDGDITDLNLSLSSKYIRYTKYSSDTVNIPIE